MIFQKTGVCVRIRRPLNRQERRTQKLRSTRYIYTNKVKKIKIYLLVCFIFSRRAYNKPLSRVIGHQNCWCWFFREGCSSSRFTWEKTTEQIIRFAGDGIVFNQATWQGNVSRENEERVPSLYPGRYKEKPRLPRFDVSFRARGEIGRLFAEPCNLMNTNSRGSRAISAAHGKTEIAIPTWIIEREPRCRNLSNHVLPRSRGLHSSESRELG